MREADIRDYFTYTNNEGEILSELHFQNLS